MTSHRAHVRPGSASGESWRCPRCGADRAGEDAFCGRCGTQRPGPGPAIGEETSGSGRDRFPVRRALILNGVIVTAVLLAVAFGRDGGPTAIRFEPGVWRCDGLERAWIATIPARATDLRVEWRRGGPEGELGAAAETARLALEAFATGGGAFRVTTTDRAAPECALEPGTWTMAIRDAASNTLLASGEVQLAAPEP